MKHQKGFTLIEIMIAALIGVFLVAGVMNLFITTNKSVTLNDAVGQNQETGRFAMDYLTRFFRNAGYNTNFNLNIPYLMLPFSANRVNITCNGAQADACAQNNPGARGDRISLPFVADANVAIRSCTGTWVGGPVNGEQILSNVFWVSEDPATEKDLRCRTYDIENQDWLDDAVSIINNVEAMEFQLGVAPQLDSGSKNAARYVSIDTMDESALLFIRSFRVALLTTSADPEDDRKIQTNIETRTYGLLDAPHMVFTDGNLRNVFSSTVEITNAIETAHENND